MDNPFFSIIIALYKETPNQIKTSINSIINQTYKNFEIILIIDNPDFIHKDLLLNLLKKNDRVKIIYNNKNLGLTKSLNIGIRNSIGKYIVRQDGDDFSLEDRLKKAYQILIKNKIQIYSSPAIVNGVIKPNILIRKFFTPDILRYKNMLFHGALIIKRDIIKEFKYDEKYLYSQDFELYNRLLDSSKSFFYDKNNISYNLILNDKSISSLRKNEQRRFFLKVLKRNGCLWTQNPILRILRIDLILDLFLITKNKLSKFIP